MGITKALTTLIKTLSTLVHLINKVMFTNYKFKKLILASRKKNLLRWKNVAMYHKIDVEVWKNCGMWAWNRGTILGVLIGGCHWKNRGPIQEQQGTLQRIRSGTVLLPTPLWHDGLATWHDASGFGRYLRVHSSCFL